MRTLLITLSGGTVLGIYLYFLIIRKLGRLAEKSVIASEVFSFLSGYRIKSYIVRDSLMERDTKLAYDAEYKNIILILKSNYGFTKTESHEAIQYAIEEKPDASIEDKIRVALQYLDSQNKQLTSKNN